MAADVEKTTALPSAFIGVVVAVSIVNGSEFDPATQPVDAPKVDAP
jgi:hypothetical protein